MSDIKIQSKNKATQATATAATPAKKPAAGTPSKDGITRAKAQGPFAPGSTTSAAGADFQAAQPVGAKTVGGGAPDQRLSGLIDSGASPASIRTYVSTLSESQKNDLVRHQPDLVGNTNGMPPAMRYDANRLRMEHAQKDAAAQDDTAKADTISKLLADPNRQFILFDAQGDGRIAEVFGNLDTAQNVTTVVPGINNQLDNFQNFSDNVKNLQREAELRAPGQNTATVAWLGYDAPRTSDAPWDNKAQQWAPELSGFVDGLLLPESANTSIVAHSYGSRLTGEALKNGLTVDNIAVIGSPGMGVNDVGDFSLPEGTDFYAGRAPGDFVSWSSNFGLDPSDPRFGATRFETGFSDDGQVSGHSDYFSTGSESLRNLSYIVTDQDSQVSLRRPSMAEQVGIYADQAKKVLEFPVDIVQQGLSGLDDVTRRGEDWVQGHLPAGGTVNNFFDGFQDFRSNVVEGANRVVDFSQRATSPDLIRDVAGDLGELGVVDKVAEKGKSFLRWLNPFD